MDLPDSYFTYDESAISAQRNHFQLIRYELSLLVVVAVLSVIIALSQNDIISTISFSVIFFLFLIGILIQLQSTKKQYGRKWFEFRAVAESIKSLAWQYGMACGDFSEENIEANKLFLQKIKQVKEIYHVNPDPKAISEAILNDIKQSMEELRKIGWQEKKEVYFRERIDDQINWYTYKARMNEKYSRLYDYFVIFLQFVGIGICIAFLYTRINGAPALALIVTLIAGIIGWNRSKQHGELVEPYQNTARELNEIRQEIELAKEETDFQCLIQEAEQAISREHTMWRAKRGLYSLCSLA